MPRNLFKEEGIDPYEDTSEKRAPRNLFAEAGIVPEKSMLGKAADIGNIPVDFLLGAGDSVGNLERSLLNIVPGINIPEAKTGSGTAYKVGNVAGDIAGFIGGGELLDTARAGAEAAPYIGKLAKSLGGDGLNGVARRALGSGAYGALENQDDRFKGASEMGALSVALDALFGGASKLLPSNMLRGNLSNEDLLKNLEAARGTNTPLGDVVGSPGLKKSYENLTTNVPFSGSDVTSANIKKQVGDIGNGIFNTLSNGANNSDLKEAIGNALNKSYNEAVGLKRQHYKSLDDLANTYGLKIDTPTFQSTANDILTTVKESPRLMEEIDKTFLNKLQNYANPMGGEKIKSTNVFKGILGDKARESYKGGKDYEGGIYKSLKDALENDVSSAFESTGDPALQEKYRYAQDFYRDNIAPFEQPEIEKFIRKGGDTDTILSTFVKGGGNDRANLLSKLMDKLPEKDKNLVPAAYFSGAFKDGKINSQKMRTLYEKLGTNQKDVLLPKDMKQEMDKFSTLVGMNDGALTRMANPKTGMQAIQSIIAKGLLGGGAITGTTVGGPVGGILGAIAGPALGAGMARGFNKYTTSPNVRESMVNSIIQGSPRDTLLKYLSTALKPLAGLGFKN